MKKMWEGYKYRHTLLDVIWTGAVIILAFTVLRQYWPAEIVSQDIAIYASIATIAGALLGFAITAISVLIAFLGSEDFQELREHPYYLRLFGDYKRAIILFGVTTIIGLIAILVNEKGEVIRGLVLLALTLWLTLFSGVTMAHAMRILWIALKAHANINRDQ